LLYTVYSIPNIVLPFFGGYLCDMLGAPLAFFLFAVAITAGQVVFAFGVSVKSLGLMYLGRIMFGLGGENMSVGSSVILEEWFRNKEMALAMGLNVAISRIGSVVNNVVSPSESCC
jgi:MFS family permease